MSEQKNTLAEYLKQKRKELETAAVKNVEAEKLLNERSSLIRQQRITINAQLELVTELENKIKDKPANITDLNGKTINIPVNITKEIKLPQSA